MALLWKMARASAFCQIVCLRSAIDFLMDNSEDANNRISKASKSKFVWDNHNAQNEKK